MFTSIIIERLATEEYYICHVFKLSDYALPLNGWVFHIDNDLQKP
jgi:hypothetical protein